MVEFQYYDPTLGEVRDGNCYKRTYCLIFNKLYSEITHMDYNSVVNEITNPLNKVDFPKKNVEDFDLEGLYVIVISGHVFPIKDSIIYDSINKTQQDEVLKSKILGVYKFPNYQFTDYTKYEFKEAKYYIGGIQLETDSSDVKRILLRPCEDSVQESLYLISASLNSKEFKKVEHSNINYVSLPNLEQAKFISDKIDEVCIWINENHLLKLYQKDRNQIEKDLKGDIFLTAELNDNYGEIISLELFGMYFKAIRLFDSVKKYILVQALGSTDKSKSVINYVVDTNKYIKNQEDD